jgi:hypothetical protein
VKLCHAPRGAEENEEETAVKEGTRQWGSTGDDVGETRGGSSSWSSIMWLCV